MSVETKKKKPSISGACKEKEQKQTSNADADLQNLEKKTTFHLKEKEGGKQGNTLTASIGWGRPSKRGRKSQK